MEFKISAHPFKLYPKLSPPQGPEIPPFLIHFLVFIWLLLRRQFQIPSGKAHPKLSGQGHREMRVECDPAAAQDAVLRQIPCLASHSTFITLKFFIIIFRQASCWS